MSIRLGIYDFFAYTIPGTFYLLIVIYAGAIWGFFDNFIEICTSISLVSALFFLGAGYVTGLIIDPIARRWQHLFYHKGLAQKAFDTFLEKHPNLSANIKASDRSLLKSYLWQHHIEHIEEIERFNATRLMLRNISLGLLALAVIHSLSYFSFNHTIQNLVLAILFMTLSLIAVRQSIKLRKWYYSSLFTAAATEVLKPEYFFEWHPTSDTPSSEQVPAETHKEHPES